VLNLGFGEIAVILVVALVFIGPKMLPELATNLGKAIREIRKATSDIRQEIELDDAIRKPLQELRDAATLPPEELKRRDELLASERKAEEAEKQRKQKEALSQASIPAAAEPTIVDPTIITADNMTGGSQAAAVSKFTGETIAREKPIASPGSIFPAEVISAGGTMILHPPSLEKELTPTIEFDTPSPVKIPVRPLPLPPPPPVPPSAQSVSQSSPSISPIVRSPTPAIGSAAMDERTQIDLKPSPAVAEKLVEPTKPTPSPRPTMAEMPSTPANPSSSPNPRGSSRKKRG
jgi:Tat protein translocase TatB subunit